MKAKAVPCGQLPWCTRPIYALLARTSIGTVRLIFLQRRVRPCGESSVDRARARQRAKRGGKLARHVLDDVVVHFEPPSEDVLALHEHLDLFAEKFPAKANLENDISRQRAMRFNSPTERNLESFYVATILLLSRLSNKAKWRFVYGYFHWDHHQTDRACIL